MKKDVNHKRTEDDRSVVAIFKDVLWTPNDVRWQIAGFQKCQCCKCRQAKVETTATNAWSDGNWSLSRSTRTCRFTSAIYMHFSILEWQFLNMLTYAFASCKHPWEFCNQIWIPTLEKPYLPHIALLLRRPHAGQICLLAVKVVEKVSLWTNVFTPCCKLKENHRSTIFRSIKFHQPHFSQHLLAEHLSGPVTSQLLAVWPVLSRITFPTWRTGNSKGLTPGRRII